MVRALASHQCGLSLFPRLGAMHGLNLFVLYSALSCFSPGAMVRFDLISVKSEVANALLF